MEAEELSSINRKDIESDKALVSACEVAALSSACHVERQKMERDKFSYSGAEYTPVYGYPSYTQYKDIYEEEYGKIAKFSERYDVLKNAKINADKEFYKATGIDPSWIGRIDVANNVVASIAGVKLSEALADKAYQSLPRGVNSNEKLPVVGKTEGYKTTQATINGDVVVKATGKIEQDEYIGVNQKAKLDRTTEKPTLIFDVVKQKEIQKGKILPNATDKTAHAEIEVIQKAFNSGKTKGATLEMRVEGKDVCGHCRKDIASIADRAGLSKVIVNAISDKDGRPKVYFWEKGMNQIKEIKPNKKGGEDE